MPEFILAPCVEDETGLYRPVPEGIQVLHVYHGARDIDALFDELQ